MGIDIMSKLTIRNLYRTYANHQMALKDFKLEVKNGELVALVGPSESGKSVLLRIIAGLESSTDGAIWFDEQLMNETDAKARQVAMVFQNYMLYPEMNVFDNLAFGLKLLKYPPSKMKNQVNEIAQKLDMVDMLTKMPSELQPVEYFKVVLVRALVKEPRILLLDDPIAQLPKECQKDALKELHTLQRIMKVTTVFATECSEEAFEIGDRVAVMKEGELLQIGTPREILDMPMSMSVAGAMMKPIMSFAEIEIREKGDHLETTFFGEPHHVEEEIERILRKKGYVDKKVILGIRPDDLVVFPLKDEEKEGQAGISEVKYVKAYNGNEYAHFDYNGAAFAGRIEEGSELLPEDKIVICYKNKVPLLFNKDTGDAILYER